MKIKISELEGLVKKSLMKYGYESGEVETISKVLLYAQLRGNNQGIVKLIGKGMPKNPEAGEIKILKETKLSALLDGNKNQGMVVQAKALELVLVKVKEHGFGIVGTNNTCTSTGAIGYYANEIAKQGYIGLAMAGSPETVNTYGSYEPIFGTNPLSIGIPNDGDPVVLDMATAAMAYFGLIEAKTAGKQIPQGIAVDKNGQPTTDPAEAMEGAILPFEPKKGSALAMMVEILTGPLVRATFVGIGEPNNWGNLMIAIDPELLTDLSTFKKEVARLVGKVKSTKKFPGVEEIFVPGERGNRLTRKHLEFGEIEVEDNLLQQLMLVAEN